MNHITHNAQNPACRKRRRRIGAALGAGLLLVAAARLRGRTSSTDS